MNIFKKLLDRFDPVYFGLIAALVAVAIIGAVGAYGAGVAESIR
jgi:hypothetical protein